MTQSKTEGDTETGIKPQRELEKEIESLEIQNATLEEERNRYKSQLEEAQQALAELGARTQLAEMNELKLWRTLNELNSQVSALRGRAAGLEGRAE